MIKKITDFLAPIHKSITQKSAIIGKEIKNRSKKAFTWTKKRPVLSLIILLVCLLSSLTLNAFLDTPTESSEIEVTPKEVSVFTIGKAPRILVSAQVIESNVITVKAQSNGIVHSIAVKTGQYVPAYQQLAALSSTYSGANAASLQRKIAEVQYQNVLDTYDAQKTSISLNKELTQLQNEDAEKQREITQASLEETRDLLELNESILSTIDASLTTATESATIASLTSQKAQLLSGINQIKAGLRQSEYYASEDAAINRLAETSKENTLQQLEIQEKALEMSVEISSLQLKLARVQETMMFPATPCAGTVERIFVTPGQMVSPGTPIATIKADSGTSQLIAHVSQHTAKQLSYAEPTYITIAAQTIELYPQHISTVPTDGSLYSVTYTLPEEHQNTLAHNSYVPLSIPVGSADTSSVIPFLPLEAIHQSEKESSIYIVKDNTVHSQTVTLGSVQGRYVEITSELPEGTQIILDRSLIEGERVQVQ